MICEMELVWLSSLGERLQTSEDSDRVREGRALQALLEAHDELKKPHIQALTQATLTGGSERDAQLKAVSANLRAAVEAAGSESVPDQSHKEALKAAALAARSAILEIIGAPQ